MRQRCPQIDTAYYPPLNSSMVDEKPDLEDCLALNVFTPQVRRKTTENLVNLYG